MCSAIADHRVETAWQNDSVLPGHTVGSLVGHVAAGTVWVVGPQLDAELPDQEVDYEIAADFFAVASDLLTDDDHATIRGRAAAVAEMGHEQVVAETVLRLAELRPRLVSEPLDRVLRVYLDKVMRLGDFLWTRVVEQVVHLDDLARSIGIEPWPNPADAEALVISCGAEIGRRRHGGAAMIRTLYRNHEPTLPIF